MITDLRLQQFRSYKDASFKVGPSVNIIVGPNASGKTNLLEAVLVVARGGSYRAKDAELVQHVASWARLDAGSLETKRTIKFQVDESGRTIKRFEIDDQTLSRLPQARTLPIVLFEPNNLALLSSSPDIRRQFLDDILEQTEPGFGTIRRHYKRVLSQRNSLLKKNPPNIGEQLFVWNIRLSELGGAIAKQRMVLISRFKKHIEELYAALAGQKQSSVGLAYVSSCSVENYETSLLQKLDAATELDVLRGFTAYGPHRDDLEVRLQGYAVQDAASRGETRTLVLALKIMEAQIIEELRSQRPLLLLDDVFSELDSERRKALTRFISGYQAFITTTDADIVKKHFKDSTIISPTQSQTSAPPL